MGAACADIHGNAHISIEQVAVIVVIGNHNGSTGIPIRSAMLRRPTDIMPHQNLFHPLIQSLNTEWAFAQGRQYFQCIELVQCILGIVNAEGWSNFLHNQPFQCRFHIFMRIEGR